MVPVPPSQATIVSCQLLSSQATPCTSWSRTVIAGGLASVALNVGRYDRPAAAPIAAPTAERGDTGPQYVGQSAPGLGELVWPPPPLACSGGGAATTIGFGGGGAAFTFVLTGARLADGDGDGLGEGDG